MDALLVVIALLVFLAAVAALLYYAPWPPPELLGGGQRQEVRILDVIQASHDTKRFRISLGAKGRILGLPVGKSIIVYAPNPDACLRTGEWNGKTDPDRGQREVDRPYTPITGTEVDGYFDLLVKIYKPGTTRTSEDEQVSWSSGGKVSQYLDSKGPGDIIEINGPRGNVEYLGCGMVKLPNRALSAKHICMLAGGTGITPMMQVLRRAIRDKADYCRFTLIYANKTEEDILLRDVLEGLVNEGKGQLNVVYTLDFPPAKWKEEKGHISAGMIRKHFPPPRRKSFDPLILMCGPAPMVELACRKNLEALGYPIESLVAL